ncbi:hypothetical protein J2W91_000058 [Paenibacillus amylolyticus]|uniref:Uncharacterized protein n=1 Tax=Paenibacillus amylolyticus TaxID=1451 RepID=A0AAP5LL22_PAEAM|nr:hypothetical protein [Paenibacillus amylolyticus]MDR6721610.1 hypothetical protein [Paenibacillus amylolyticus]
MKKRYTKLITWAAVILSIATIVVLINNYNSNKNTDINSRYYQGLISRVQKLDQTLDKIKESEANGNAVPEFDVLLDINFVNDFFTTIKEQTRGFPDVDVLRNDFTLFRFEYANVVRNQLESNEQDTEIQLKVAHQIKLFLDELPEEYEDSTPFTDQFNAAAQHIKPLIHLNF